jgi:sugar O-acyltransferase (sialic acid O-acetyltransferase NeuD family)
VTPPRLLERIVAPLVNTNEPEARVVELSVTPFGRVAAGQVVCVLETSKSTMEVESAHEGWVGEVHVALFDDITAGALICEVFDAEPPPAAAGAAAAAGPEPRLTRKAEALARQAGIDLALLPTDRFVTEQDVRELVARTAERVELDPALLTRIEPGAVVVFGGGGLGKTLIECLAATPGLAALCVVDDGLPAGGEVLGVPVAGGRAALAALAAAGATMAVNGVGAIGRAQTRIDIVGMLADHGFSLPALAHPGAHVSPSAVLGAGAQVHAGAVVSSDAVIGRGAIVNSGAIASHDCRVGDHVHLAPGAVLAGDVSVGEAALVGMGATVALGLRIGARALVGNGAVVTADVPEGTIVAAGAVWAG